MRRLLLTLHLFLFLAPLVLKERHRWCLEGVLILGAECADEAGLGGLHLRRRAPGLQARSVISKVAIYLHLLEALADLLDFGDWLAWWRSCLADSLLFLLFVLEELS